MPTLTHSSAPDRATEPPATLAARPTWRRRRRPPGRRATEVVDRVHVECRALAGGDDRRAAGRRPRSPAGTRRHRLVRRASARARGRARSTTSSGAGSLKANTQNPPVGRYLSRRSSLDVVPHQLRLVHLRGVPPLVERGELGRAARAGRTPTSAGRGARRACPSRGRASAAGSMKSAVVGHRLGAELRHEPHHARHAPRRAGRGRGRRRGTSRSTSGCRCRRAAGGGAARRECGTTVGSGRRFSNGRFTQRSSTVLFHDGSCWPAT